MIDIQLFISIDKEYFLIEIYLNVSIKLYIDYYPIFILNIKKNYSTELLTSLTQRKIRKYIIDLSFHQFNKCFFPSRRFYIIEMSN